MVKKHVQRLEDIRFNDVLFHFDCASHLIDLPGLRKIGLYGRSSMQLSSFAKLIKHLPLLEEVEVMSIGPTDDAELDSQLVGLPIVPNMRCLAFRLQFQGICMQMNAFLQKLPSLRRLYIGNMDHREEVMDMSHLVHLHTLHMEAMIFHRVQTPLSLSRLTFNDRHTCLGGKDRQDLQCDVPLQSLELSIYGTHRFDNDRLAAYLFQSRNTLHKLDLRNHTQPDLAPVKRAIETGQLLHLQTLRLPENDLDDDFFTCLAQNCPQIQTLYLRRSTKLTGVGLKACVVSLSRLSSLDIVDCSAIGADAITWTRSKVRSLASGVTAPVTGRRVRYSY